MIDSALPIIFLIVSIAAGALALMLLHRLETIPLRTRISALEEYHQLAEGALNRLRLDNETIQSRRAALIEMEQVWCANKEGNEDPCRDLFLAHPWVLYPDYVISALEREIGLGTVLNRLGLGNADEISAKFRMNIDTKKRVDLVGLAEVCASVQPNFRQTSEPVLLIIELKHSAEEIKLEHMEQAHYYSVALMLAARDRLLGKPIDALVVGRTISPEVSDFSSRWHHEVHRAIRIIPITYDRLFERARLLAGQNLSDKKIIENSVPLAA